MYTLWYNVQFSPHTSMNNNFSTNTVKNVNPTDFCIIFILVFYDSPAYSGATKFFALARHMIPRCKICSNFFWLIIRSFLLLQLFFPIWIPTWFRIIKLGNMFIIKFPKLMIYLPFDASFRSHLSNPFLHYEIEPLCTDSKLNRNASLSDFHHYKRSLAEMLRALLYHFKAKMWIIL